MASIRLEKIEKVFGKNQAAVRSLDLEIADGAFVVLVGPSGCGKSTTLRIIAGLETPTRGKVFLGEQDVTAFSPQERDLAMVFQSYALYPHKAVRQNLEFGLRMRGVAPAVISERVERIAKVLGLETLLERKPGQLSGGQRQRVALGRAIVREPKAFLLDEPLSNLDAKLRVQTRAELSRMHRQLSATMVYVTHDQEEAMTLGDQIAVMNQGVLEQVAPPLEIYRRPATAFVAGFIGSPTMNFFRCTLRQDGTPRLRSSCFDIALNVDASLLTGEREVLLGIRPQDIRLAEGEADSQARVDVIQPLGNEMVQHIKLLGQDNGTSAMMIVPAEMTVQINDQLGLHFPRERLHLFDTGPGRRLGAAPR
ncbi:MAG: sn-glycerol-3-phosphate ABC transporter ATP-binding protein UgpC [Gemmataceae bacterium]|nr:sn-glycerol-3-phosphate ABC transporter ATP-binding protein UgpC [Gemmataceae bacterium]MCI0743203.1 sn-glycerol-3-phosphate ABC transporter ATP-binding protein UgpC [Gemmataceae bacterium]